MESIQLAAVGTASPNIHIRAPGVIAGIWHMCNSRSVTLGTPFKAPVVYGGLPLGKTQPGTTTLVLGNASPIRTTEKGCLRGKSRQTGTCRRRVPSIGPLQQTHMIGIEHDHVRMSTSVFVWASLVVMTDGIAAQAAWLLRTSDCAETSRQSAPTMVGCSASPRSGVSTWPLPLPRRPRVVRVVMLKTPYPSFTNPTATFAREKSPAA
jgi:hypothetical protein